MSGFLKDDQDKLRMSLVQPEFIEGIAEVLTEGAKVYGANNWKTLPPKDKYRYKDALLRHVSEYMKGNILDSSSHKSHLLHAACNLMFLYYMDQKDH